MGPLYPYIGHLWITNYVPTEKYIVVLLSLFLIQYG